MEVGQLQNVFRQKFFLRFTHSFSKYLLSTCLMHGNELCTVRRKKDELNLNFAFKELDCLKGEISAT